MINVHQDDSELHRKTYQHSMLAIFDGIFNNESKISVLYK